MYYNFYEVREKLQHQQRYVHCQSTWRGCGGSYGAGGKCMNLTIENYNGQLVADSREVAAMLGATALGACPFCSYVLPVS